MKDAAWRDEKVRHKSVRERVRAGRRRGKGESEKGNKGEEV